MASGKALSIDLRERAVQACKNREGTIKEIAQRFKIGTATLSRWKSRDKKTGSVTPSKKRGAAITAWGMAALATVDAGMTGDLCISWVKQMLLPMLSRGMIVVMDNLQAHKRPEIQELIESVGAELWFQPKYSPDFNPIEPSFSKVKNVVRGLKPRNRKELDEAIVKGADAINADDTYGWFNMCHSGYHVN